MSPPSLNLCLEKSPFFKDIVAFHWFCSNLVHITHIYYRDLYSKIREMLGTRKKVTSRDICWAMEDLDLSNHRKVGRKMTGGTGSFTMLGLARIRGVFVLFFRFWIACAVTTHDPTKISLQLLAAGPLIDRNCIRIHWKKIFYISEHSDT